MSNEGAKSCGCCGRAIEKAHAIHDNRPYCVTCYAREFAPTKCEICGKTVRTLGGRGPAVCKTCRTRDRACMRCGKPTPRASFTSADGVACAPCAKFFKPARCCPVCGQMSLYLARDLRAGFSEPVCQRCRSKGHITCSGCRKHRRPAGLNSASKIVCSRCLEGDGQQFLCPKCGERGKRHSAARCDGCYWRDSLHARLQDGLALLGHAWVRDAFSKFIDETAGRIPSRIAALRLQKYLVFFMKLDACCPNPSRITASILAETFGAEGLRRHSVPYGFLIKASLIPRPNAEALRDAQEADRQDRLLAKFENTWYVEVLDRYRDHLQSINDRYARRGWTGGRARFVTRTITQNLRAASIFLTDVDAADVKSPRQIDPTHVDRFCLDRPGYRSGLRAFIRYLNAKERLFAKLKLENISTELPPGIFLPADRYRQLLGHWLGAPDEALKEALIGLMMLLYAQPVKRLVRLKLADIRKDRSGHFSVAFGHVEIDLHTRIAELMDRYIVHRRALATMEDEWENDYLFPGRLVGSHLTEAAVTHHLKKQGIRAEQLFSTAIYQSYINGIRHPKILVDAFGISTATAIRYMKMIDPRLRTEVEIKTKGRTTAPRPPVPRPDDMGIRPRPDLT